ncbi:MAG: hypothetical protein HC866_07385 [Leptolyngbyaceae cyanobacterium RU_5_1]|nr:hypothetical protein [Leptolyngbyaceae cyanobacterium RU_5_1]
MVHTYEVLVDIREYFELTSSASHNETARYEVDAESRQVADGMARIQAKRDHPKCTECDVRVTRLLR